MHTATPAQPAADDLQTPRLVLRDGSVTMVRSATASDHQAMRQFFHDLRPSRNSIASLSRASRPMTSSTDFALRPTRHRA